MTIDRKRTTKRWLGIAVALAMLFAGPILLAEQAEATDQTETKAMMDDWKITQAINNELWLTRGVNADAIDVTTTAGIVTLEGTTNNILAKKRAENVASTLKGVRSVVNQIHVEPTARSDQEIKRDIVAALATDPATDSWEVDVSVRAGEVTLGGTVQSWQEKQLAETVTQGVKGVLGVENEIDIRYTAERSDQEIASEIERTLMWDVRVNDALVDVDVDQGIVTLSGSVGSVYDRSHAIADAWVTGVEAVKTSDLKVQWWALDEMMRKERYVTKSDDDIARAVRDAMLYDPRVASFQPEIHVENGTVTLTGKVDNLKAKNAAAQDAANTVGVWRVKNHLKVRPAERMKDSEVAEEIKTDLLIDPYVDRFEIDVSVNDGIAYLSGSTDTHFEKWQAGDIASRVPGVVAVKNRLKVDYQPRQGDVAFYDWNVVKNNYDVNYEPLMLKSDWAIKEDIDREMFWSPFVDADEVTVLVADGIATLQGTVDSWAERNSAAEQAIEGGAVAVDNNLAVEWGPDLPIL